MDIVTYVSMETWKHVEIDIWRYGNMDTLRHQIKMEAEAIFLNPLLCVHHANEGLSFVHLLQQKQTEVIHLQTD
jgi:hypothetical protein